MGGETPAERWHNLQLDIGSTRPGVIFKSLYRPNRTNEIKTKERIMKIAGVQMDVKFGDIDGNIGRMIDRLRETVDNGACLTIFPECSVTGYCFKSLEEAREYAQPIPGDATGRIADACEELDTYAVFGMVEAAGDDTYNAAVMTGPTGVLGSYRKIHLPFLGLDQFSNYGDRPFQVVDAGDLKVGMNICYDSAFPESSRALSIDGADLIALPTNWPPGAENVANYAINTRAMENGVYYAAINRVGDERGFSFIGRSSICDPSGKTLAKAEHRNEEILYAEIDPAAARMKQVVRVPGEHAIDRMADRRPEMYGKLVEPHSLQRPGRDVNV